MTAKSHFLFWPSLILCTSSLAALEALFRRLEHFRHEDHSIPGWLRTVLIVLLIPLVSGFLAARPTPGLSRKAAMLPLFLSPSLLAGIKLALDDASGTWLARESVSLAILACVASVFAAMGGLLRSKAESG